MKEIAALCLVFTFAYLLSLAIGGSSQSIRNSYEIEATMERMKANPNPEYDRYPKVNNSDTTQQTIRYTTNVATD